MYDLDLPDGDGWKPVVIGIRFTDDEKILIHFRIFWWGCHYRVVLEKLTREDGEVVELTEIEAGHIEAARSAVYDHISDQIAEMVMEEDDYEPEFWN